MRTTAKHHRGYERDYLTGHCECPQCTHVHNLRPWGDDPRYQKCRCGAVNYSPLPEVRETETVADAPVAEFTAGDRVRIREHARQGYPRGCRDMVGVIDRPPHRYDHITGADYLVVYPFGRNWVRAEHLERVESEA